MKKSDARSYGCGGADEAAVLVGHPALSPTAQSKNKSKRKTLAAVALAVCVGGAALLAFSQQEALQLRRTAGEPATLIRMETNQVGFAVPAILQTGREFLLRLRGKNDLCVDDGGGLTRGLTKLSPWPCNPSNVNQMFVYDPATYQIRSARKPNLCVDDAAIVVAGTTRLQLWDCDRNNVNQRFIYDAATQMFRNPMKNNLCIDDGAAVRAGVTQFTLYTCDNNNPNQHLEIKFRDEWQAEQQRVVDAVAGGAKFVLKSVGKDNLCVDDGGATTNGGALMQLWSCDSKSQNQVWWYDAAIKRIRSANKKGLCIDDGNAVVSGAKLWLWACDATNKNQEFVFDKALQLFKNPNKVNLCIDDAATWTPGGGKMQSWTCDVYNTNQHFVFVPVVAYAVPDILQTGREFVVATRGKTNLCLDDGGAVAAGSGRLSPSACNASSPNQIFVYDPATYQLRSARKPTLCVDDGGITAPPGDTKLQMQSCDTTSANQRFVIDTGTGQIRNPTKADLCLDDGGASQPGQSAFTLWQCDDKNANQHFDIIFRDDWLAGQQRAVGAVAGGAKFVIKSLAKGNVCADDGGTSLYGEARMRMVPCDLASPNQIWWWDAATSRVRSHAKPGFCLDDSGNRLSLSKCDPASKNQNLVFDKDAHLVRDTNKANMCLDDGAAFTSGTGWMVIAPCNPSSQSQLVELVVLSTVPEFVSSAAANEVYGVPAALRDGREFVLKIRDKQNFCLDDGGGSTRGATKFVTGLCAPSSASQLFVYDPATYQIRSARKPNLCVDDGGTVVLGFRFKIQLWDCDVANANQRFVYDRATQMFRNPTKTNLCLDDGGAVRVGWSQPTLASCDPKSSNQRFEILFRDDWQAERQRTLDAVAGGAKFVIRSMAKGDLCVDDGEASMYGGAVMRLMACDLGSPNQIWWWDAATSRVRSYAKAGFCLDDSGGSVSLSKCDPASKNQNLVFDKDSRLFRDANDVGVCMDDGDVTISNPGRMVTSRCNPSSQNQLVELILLPTVPAFVKTTSANATYDVPSVLLDGREFLLKLRDKSNLCLDDGGGSTRGETKFMAWLCNPSSANQLFKYDPATYQIRSARKPNLCVDDAGTLVTGSRSAMIQLWDCDAANANQRFVYDTSTQVFRNPTKNELCLDDGGAVRPGGSQPALVTCDPKSPNQHLTIAPAETWQAEQQGVLDAVAGGAKFLLKATAKDNLCVDDGGAPLGGDTQLQLWTCDPGSANQVWWYDAASKRLRSYAKPGQCVDDVGMVFVWTKLWLRGCDATATNQDLVFDKVFQQVQNPNRPNLCVDDGGATKAGAAKMQLAACDVRSLNQRLDIVVVAASALPEVVTLPPPVWTALKADYETPALLRTGREFLLRPKGDASVCVDDNRFSPQGVAAMPCNPFGVSQAFVYDPATLQILSVRAPNLCLDDAGARFPRTQLQLWACDKTSVNQRFIYDEATQMFRNPMRNNMCMDDGALTPCDKAAPRQHYEIKFRDEWQAEKQRVLDAVAGGAKFVIRSVFKPTLCVGDGRASAGWAHNSPMQMAVCDVASWDQVWVWEAATRHIRSFYKPDLCIDDGGATATVAQRMYAALCAANSKNQEFVYDKVATLFRNPNKGTMCLDDGGFRPTDWISSTKMRLFACEDWPGGSWNNGNEHYEYVLVK